MAAGVTPKIAVACPACSSTHTKTIKEWRLAAKHKAIACWRCGLVFSHPQPPAEALDAYYQPDGGWREFRPDPQGTEAQSRQKGPGGTAMLDLLDTHIPPGARRRVLDFGCGVGAWLNVLQDRGWETFGIEPSSDAAFVRHQRLQQIPSDASFDLLVVYHVLEHLPRPLDTLRELAKAVRIGGWCFVSVPRLDTVAVHRQLTYCLHPRHHLVAYTEACLRGLLAAAGFEVVTALHQLDADFTNGVPLRMRLLARRVPEERTWLDPAKSLQALFTQLLPVLASEQSEKAARNSADLLPGTPRVTFSLSMLGWALNEEESIGAYVERAGDLLAALTDDFELIVIDDGSRDRTWQILQEMQRTRPWLRAFQNERNRGSGYNTKRAISLATKDYVFWQTVDWAYDIRELLHGLGALREVDVLQGVRRETTSAAAMVERRSDSAYKGLVSVVNYRLIRTLFRLPLGDYQNVTVYPRALIQSVTLETESSFTNAECLLKTWWKGATFKEVHVPFVKRTRGTGTGTRPRAIVAAIRDILSWWFRWIVLGRRSDNGRGRVVRDVIQGESSER